MRTDKQLPQVAGQLFVKAFDPQSCLNNRCVQTKDLCKQRLYLNKNPVNINCWNYKMKKKKIK